MSCIYYRRSEWPIVKVLTIQTTSVMIVLVVDVLKWILILTTVVSNNTLVWKIWTRKNLHTIFNLSMCFFFLWVGFFAPFLFYEYGNLLVEMINHPETSCPEICQKIVLLKFVNLQSFKVFITNIGFR